MSTNFRTRQFGLSALLRSTDGGVNWELIQIPLAVAERSDLIIYDIDYVTDENNVIHTFMSAGHVIKTTNSLGVTSCTYHGGIFYSDNVFAATPAWKNIAKETNLGAPLTNVVSLALLTKNANSILEVSDLEIRLYASRHVVSNETVDGGVYESFTTLADLAASATPQLTWTNVRSGHRFFQLGVKPGSTKDNHEIFVGKRHGEEIDLRARSVTPSVITNFARIVDPENTSLNNDNGYRELEPKNGVQNTQLKFGSFDFNPDRTNETYAHPTVYGCWGYGPLKAEGHNSNFNTARAYEQIFTTNTAGGNDGTWVSRGIMDEVFFNGPTAAFHPTNPNIVLIGCGDNGLLRTETINDFTAKWYQNRLIPAENWYGGDNQFVYHLAFHPLNANIVIAAAGTDNHRPAITGKGGLLKNTASGAGTAASWSMIAGGPGGSNGLPDAEIQSFVFDVKDDNDSDDKLGMFVAARNKGIYYGMINMNTGNVASGFQFKRIANQQLIALIPAQADPNNPGDDGPHHYYSRLMFDPGNLDHLYVARHWPAGGVFRITLGSSGNNRAPYLTGGNYNENFITGVDEIILGRMTAKTAENLVTNTRTAEVLNLLVTSNYVFAGATCGHREDDINQNNYAGGLVRWDKNEDPGDYNWIIGGPAAMNSTSNTIAIGGLVEDPLDHNRILAVTYRFTLGANRINSSNKYQGEDNDKNMNFWHSTNAGASFSIFGHSSSPYPGFTDAVTLAINPDNPDKVIMPTHGNGVWIGYRTPPLLKAASPTDSAQADGSLPKKFALHGNYPNPFNPATLIKYDLPKTTEVSLAIYDVLGRCVRILVDAQIEAGYHIQLWDGKDGRGMPLSSGLYFVRLQTAEFNQARKMTLLRETFSIDSFLSFEN